MLLYQVQGEASLAVYHGELCLEAARRCGGALYNILFPTVVASAFVEAGRPDQALALVAQARVLSADTAYRHHDALMSMVEAYALSARHDDAGARERLAQALIRARESDTASLFRWLVVGFRRMLALALRSDVEADHARSLIVQFGVSAESPAIDPWPWPIRIRTLGGFSLAIDDAPMPSQRKVQKKPLELLKYLVAQGGHEVGAADLDAALWPDAEGGAAAEAFEVTLRRLRKLLRNDKAITLKDGKVSLNAGVCWVDVWAFERSLVASTPDEPGERALDLYAGHFLAGDEDKPWLLACRERLASKYLRHVIAVGQSWSQRDEPAKAELVYRRGLELDPLAEALYRQLMSLQSQQRRAAEALETYRRCRHVLSVVLGLQPSAETEAMRRSFLGGS
jgi:DNA-binding SARP family transcriptional activator